MLKKYMLCVLALCGAMTLSAQSLGQAKKLFERGEYDKAKTAFAKLIKRSPSSAEVNYFYGASLYETGELDKCVKYLEKSAKRDYIGAFRYLGKAYADLYRYDEAVENYETHLEWLEKKNRDMELAEEELSEVRRRARMFKSVEKVAVIDSFVVSKKNFLDAFKISHTAGKITLNEAGDGTIYENEMGSKRIMVEKKDSLMQLYSQASIIDGWGDKHLIEGLGEDCNLNYPFLMGDGITLYYASDGEGTLGGYDIFVTRYDSEDNSYLRPSNIGMPFNSSANDYLYAVDELNNLGWFVTDRRQPADTVCVYVFVPNASKESYNYEQTDPKVIMDAATLRSISTTWTDEVLVREGRQRLAALKYSKEENTTQKADFHFLIDDMTTYTTLSQFTSSKAQAAFRQLLLKQKDLAQLRKKLAQQREQYANENGLGKKKLEPGILDLEKRIPQLRDEVEALELEVRRMEIENLRK